MLTFTALLGKIIKSAVFYFSHGEMRMQDGNGGYAALFKRSRASLMTHISLHAQCEELIQRDKEKKKNSIQDYYLGLNDLISETITKFGDYFH